MDETRPDLQDTAATAGAAEGAERVGHMPRASFYPSEGSGTAQASTARGEDGCVEEEIAQLVFELAGRFKARVGTLLGQLDLTVPQAWLLLGLDEPRSMGEVAARVRSDPSTVTWIADRLEARGLLERRPHQTDRRVKQLVLTAQGRVVRERLHGVFADVPGLSALSPADLQTLRDLLRHAVGHCS